MKQKYWYVTELTVCVVCGIEYKHRYRVYTKPERKVIWIDYACWQHFI